MPHWILHRHLRPAQGFVYKNLIQQTRTVIRYSLSVHYIKAINRRDHYQKITSHLLKFVFWFPMCIESNVAHNNYDKLNNDMELQKPKEKSYPIIIQKVIKKQVIFISLFFIKKYTPWKFNSFPLILSQEGDPIWPKCLCMKNLLSDVVCFI